MINELEIDHRLLDAVQQDVRDLEQELQANKAMIITEGDLQAHLFMKLRNRFPAYTDTIDFGITGLSVHSEITYFNADGKLVHTPDLCIIPPRALSIYKSVQYGTTPRTRGRRNRLPSKEYEFAGSSLAIEVKFCRDQPGIGPKEIECYQEDFDKLKLLHDLREERTQGRDRVLGMVVVFNKTDKGRERFEEFQRQNEHDDIRIAYGTALVDLANYDGRRSLPPLPLSI